MSLKISGPIRGADRGRRGVCCENPIRPGAGESFMAPQT